MRKLSSHEVLAVWETGNTQHPVDRALTMLAPTFPDATRADLAELPIGRRDVYLLTIHELTYGRSVQGFATCPGCGQQLELSALVSDLRAPETGDEAPLELTIDGNVVAFRIPNSRDLAAVIGSADSAEARSLLAKRCIVAGLEAEPDDALVVQLAAAIAARDPQADVELALDCPSCERTWSSVFDIASFLWAEIDAHAKRLLEQTHLLASAYGWNESDILAMSSTRRRHYLELAY